MAWMECEVGERRSERFKRERPGQAQERAVAVEHPAGLRQRRSTGESVA